MPGREPQFMSRGVYEAGEVDAFVGRLRVQIAELISQQEACAAALAETRLALDTARSALAERETEASVLTRTFTAAQRAADEMLAETAARAEAIRAAARLDAETILTSAHTEAASMIGAARAEAAAAAHAARGAPAAEPAHAEPAHARPEAPAPEPERTVQLSHPLPEPEEQVPFDATEEPWRLETAIQRAVNRAVERVPISPS